jgi:prephenate dehydratase
MVRLAYLGPPGTFSEEAALRYSSGADLLPCVTEKAAVAAVEGGDADEAVLPIENTLEGSVTRTVDILVHDTALMIQCELVLPIEMCLIGKPGTGAREVEIIYSKPEALSQVRYFIEKRFPNARQEASLSTAAAVEEMLGTERAVAIGPARAAELYGAEILERGVEDHAHNQTRFVVVAAEDHAPTGADKTSIAFAVAHDQPGSLVNVLHEFSDRAINLTKIESRPSREELGIYIFLIDLEGHRTDDSVREALASVERKATFFRLLGSYPRGDAQRSDA